MYSIISDKRIPEVFHMYAYLMGTAGFQAKGDKAVPVFFVNNFIVSDCLLAV